MSVLRAIFLSLLTHFIFLLIAHLYLKTVDLTGPSSKTVEIQIIPMKIESKREKQIVRKTEVPENQQINSKDPARFLSENRQRVVVETRAEQTGLTRNQDPRRPEPKWRPEKKFDAMKEVSGIKLPDRPMSRTSSDSPSTVGEYLPKDVSVGSFTALNTDRFTYYSFYSRVEELVRFRWESSIENAINSFDRQYILSVVANNQWVTQLDFVLTPDGRLVKALILKESGIKKFDLAPINAFREANVFPNPPKEMIEDDGYIHLKYNFTVHFNPRL